MKKFYLVLLAALSFSGASAQYKNQLMASTNAELKELEWTFPGFKNATTKVKHLVSPTKIGFETAFSFNIVRDANNNVISMQTADINENYPLDLKYRSTGVVNGNRLNIQVQTAFNATQDPFADSERQTLYKDVLGRDSLVVLEFLNGQNVYEEGRRIRIVYNTNGTIAAIQDLSPASNNYELVGYRNFGYNGTKRITDTTYMVATPTDEVVAYRRLFYNAADKLDSVTSYSSVGGGTLTMDAGYRMVYDATKGIAEIFVTLVTNNVPKFEFRIQYTGTTITSVNEINKLDDNNFVCFPVPANNELNITAKNGELYSCTLFDVFGKKIMSTNLSNQISINTGELASGVYLLNIQDANGNSTTKKITIQH